MQMLCVQMLQLSRWHGRTSLQSCRSVKRWPLRPSARSGQFYRGCADGPEHMVIHGHTTSYMNTILDLPMLFQIFNDLRVFAGQ